LSEDDEDELELSEEVELAFLVSVFFFSDFPVPSLLDFSVEEESVEDEEESDPDLSLAADELEAGAELFLA
jgi:hypothetical protein